MEDTRSIFYQDYSSAPFTKSKIDSFLAKVPGKFTDVIVAARQDNDARTWFASSLLGMRVERIDGLLPGEYFIKKATELGIKIHLWLYTGYWSTYASALTPFPTIWNMKQLPYPCNRQAWINWTIPECRAAVCGIVADYVTLNPGLAGVFFDYARIHSDATGCGVDMKDSITAFLTEVRPMLGGRELSVAMSGTASRNANVRRHPVRWLGENIVDWILVMSYVSVPIADRLAYLTTLPNPERVYPGISIVDPVGGTDQARFDQFKYHYDAWRNAGYNRFCLFDSTKLTTTVLDYLTALESQPPQEPPWYVICSTSESSVVSELVEGLSNNVEEVDGGRLVVTTTHRKTVVIETTTIAELGQ